MIFCDVYNCAYHNEDGFCEKSFLHLDSYGRCKHMWKVDNTVSPFFSDKTMFKDSPRETITVFTVEELEDDT